MSFFGELADSFTGAGAKKNIQQGMDHSIGALGQSRDQAAGAVRSGASEARGYYSPYIKQGGQAYGLYSDTLGVNGADARSRAQSVYNSDDMLAQQRAMDLKRSGQQQNASGSFNSGAAALADSRTRLQGYGNWQDRLQAAGQQGYGASAASAGVAQNEANALGGVYSGYGQNASGVYQGGYNALAQNSGTLAQNLIGVGGTLLKATGWGGFGSNKLGGTVADGMSNALPVG